eukprot:2308409-Pyramimonas_sp.AAC.1
MWLLIAENQLGPLASSTALADEVARLCSLPASVRARVHRDLGGDATDGARRRVSTQRERFCEAQQQVAEVISLRNAGAACGSILMAGIMSKRPSGGPTSRGPSMAS